MPRTIAVRGKKVTHASGGSAVAIRSIADKNVRAATGKGWDEWFSILDRAGAAKKQHSEIAATLRDKGVGPWWCQMVTVEYERARGLRDRHETAAGYQVGASKTVNVAVNRLFKAWTDDALRKKWLGNAKFTVRKSTPPKSMRITWGDGSNLDVLFYPKGDAKSYVSVDQRKLGPGKVESIKEFWKKRLEKLKEILES